LNRFFRSEAGAVILWLFVALLLAAAIAPLLYRGGHAFAETASSQEFPRVLEWLGAACGRADFSRYFNRSLMLAALILLPVLRWRIRGIHRSKQPKIASIVRAPWKSVMVQMVVGLIITGGISWGLCGLIEASGAYVLKPNPPDFMKVLSRVLFPVVVVALLEEWLFRGILLGLWMRFSKPLAACVGTSLFFAFVHFLSLPKGEVLSDPASGWAGYELLGKIGLHLMDPVIIITDFLALFAIGMILAWSRIRTGALWFSIGLHAGWIAALKMFSLLHRPVEGHWLFPWGLGDTLRSGLLSLLSILIVAGFCRMGFRFLGNQPDKT
jgi:membrane protease YdiL (CAAX protease family)